MSVPLALAAPAALAGYAYLNAKTALHHDVSLVANIFTGIIKASFREKKDRLNPFYLLEDHANNKDVAHSIFLIFEGRRWTYKQTYDTVLKYGTWLKTTYDIKAKEIVAVDAQNSEKFFFLWFGLWSIGANPAFINYNLTGKALAHCIRVSTARLLLIDLNVAENVTDEVRAELPNIEFVVFTPQLEVEAMTVDPIRQPDSERKIEKGPDMAQLIYTSGTTGLPKPAVVSWSKCNLGPLVTARWLGLKRGDVFYTCMPLYHSSAAILGVLSVINSGSTLSLGRKFSTRTFWSEVRTSEATIIQYVGETCRYLLSAPPQIGPSGENLDQQNCVKIAFGNGLRPDVWNKFKERFGIETVAEFYSATEASGMTMNWSRNDFTRGAIGRMGAVGRTLFGTGNIVELDFEAEVPKRGANGLCQEVPVGEPGELIYQLDPNDIGKKFQGYFNNEKASGTKIIRDVLKKGDVFYRTGDVVRSDADGRMYFHDRIGDTFRWKSENVSTNEVSECLGSHPAVQEANVYGVELPHHDGRAGCVALVLNSGEEASPKTLNSLAEHALKELPRFAVPIFVRVTKTMETTGTNKQQKHVLRSQGANPAKMGEDELFWLKGGQYVRFGDRDWKEMSGGSVKL